MKRARGLLAALCVLALILSTLPLYAIAFYNHPYYDDYGFSAGVHAAWKETGSVAAVLSAALESARVTRQNWQGTYTGTLLSNLQPGVFSEGLYWVGSFVLLTALLIGLGVFFETVFEALGLERWARICLGSLASLLVIQFMPDVGEAFYWYNGGIGNTFIYALLLVAAALMLRLLRTKGKGWGLTVALCVLAVALGGGSYGGGLFGLCLCALLVCALFWKKHPRRWQVLGVGCVFLACFAYSMAAPGNTVRAGVIGYRTSPAHAILQSLYHGVALLGSYVRLPVLAVTLALAPALYEAAKQSPFCFAHPWLVTLGGMCLYCTQLTPPMYSIASMGDGRIVDTYFISFIALWFPWVYYLLGVLARRVEVCAPRRMGALLLTALCLFGMGCLAFKRPGDVLYGVQNLSGPSAALSMLTGEAARYDREMTLRESLLNDETQPVVTLKPLTAVPKVFLQDLLTPNAVYDVRPSLCLYYGKEAIRVEGEVSGE